ncbi:GtrA family protein [Aneurinibacillus sp. Ricciae_BoGa-3]|uniref:GtrA family protein n=1 Tax=Aneurinibacillus sp. Ricciae_BoGa-3 TaxID=3022697 RepID=UPI0023408DFE|nr:GtrA family protein [Aneurinibacillus sp. Ricciae_BoGa-3]WCK54557.1 GtrA family protein [Aneurinibacillus sp. Ricciae_BoGa-3]
MLNFEPKTNAPLRFCVVGLLNTAVDFAVFFVLSLAMIPYLLAQPVSYSAGVINSYFLNRRWTFQVKQKPDRLEIFKFIFVNGVSLVVSSSILFITRDIGQINILFSKIAACVGGVAVNYIGSRLWVFNKGQKRRIPKSSK